MWLRLQIEETKPQKEDLNVNNDGLLMYKGRLYVPNTLELKEIVMDEFLKQPYSGHLGYHKMITTIRK